ncbi:MAG: nitrilase-related carbon-nitrogen hydrolase, partial [bacterium]|nr:nitrilase-related carbon-nitrogen hydrolase [bacterium]
MKNPLRIALAQINCTVGDISGNSEKILSYIKMGMEKGVDIIVFPEMAICGYPPEDLLLKGKFIKDNIRALNNIAGTCRRITAVIGFADSDIEGVYNAAAVINSGRVQGIYHKMILPNYGVFDEKRYFKRGDNCPAFNLDGFIFGVNICEDIWHASGPAGLLAKNGGASLIINLNASPFHAGKHLERKKILGHRVSETGASIAYANLVGGQDELVFDGGSMLMESDGTILAAAPHFKEEFLIADLPQKETGKAAISKKAILLEGKIAKKGDLISAPKAAELEPLEEIYSALVMGSRDYVEKNGFEGVIIGLSGGIDSALTAAIAMDALGSDRITGVAMPSRYSSKGSVDDAQALADNM